MEILGIIIILSLSFIPALIAGIAKGFQRAMLVSMVVNLAVLVIFCCFVIFSEVTDESYLFFLPYACYFAVKLVFYRLKYGELWPMYQGKDPFEKI